MRFFINTVLDCEQYPLDTYNQIIAAFGRDSCLKCPFQMIQPTTGQPRCINQKSWLFYGLDTESHLAGVCTRQKVVCLH